VLGYLAAGLAIGPWGLQLFTDPAAILHVAELGVVLFLFVIGLEMQPSRLWGLRRQIAGLGLFQVVVCGVLLTGAGILLGYSPAVAFVFGMGFVLTSTAIVFQMLEERGKVSTPFGQKITSILLLEDMAIVPLLAIVAFLAPGQASAGLSEQATGVAIALGVLAGLVLTGRYLLNPMFTLLAKSGAREVMTAAALLVVLGAAYAMQLGGLSMAMGAFLAGVLLSESTFRHQLEADIEPFRGILLGLFFLGVGMTLDLHVVFDNLAFLAGIVILYMMLKGIGIYAVARITGAANREAIGRASLMAQGGEFAFVLFAAAASTGIIDQATSALFSSTIVASMMLTPLVTSLAIRLMPKDEASVDGLDVPENLTGNVLIIGFGRFGQMVSQPLLARGVDVSIIDIDVEMIQVAAKFGFKVYYGDGTRLDILHAAGAANAEIIMICVDQAEASIRIAELAKAEFPLVSVMARAYDRGAALALIEKGVDYQIRETMESAFVFGSEALRRLGVDEEDVVSIIDDVRSRDIRRFEMQMTDGIYAGREYFRNNQPVPQPLTVPQQPGRAGNKEAGEIIGEPGTAS
jgi:glutathione-regulated potassium-efflux system protein KefB